MVRIVAGIVLAIGVCLVCVAGVEPPVEDAKPAAQDKKAPAIGEEMFTKLGRLEQDLFVEGEVARQSALNECSVGEDASHSPQLKWLYGRIRYEGTVRRTRQENFEAAIQTWIAQTDKRARELGLWLHRGGFMIDSFGEELPAETQDLSWTYDTGGGSATKRLPRQRHVRCIMVYGVGDRSEGSVVWSIVADRINGRCSLMSVSHYCLPGGREGKGWLGLVLDGTK